jgi:hypothetical protein
MTKIKGAVYGAGEAAPLPTVPLSNYGWTYLSDLGSCGF